MSPAPLNRQLVQDILRQNSLMVVSTLGEGDQPQSAVVGYTELPDLRLIVGTDRHSRKAINVGQRPKVSGVIGWDPKQRVTIQYDGTAKIMSQEEVQECAHAIIDKVPKKAHYLEDYLAGKSQDVYIMITPTWIRCTEAAQYPWVVSEATFSQK